MKTKIIFSLLILFSFGIFAQKEVAQDEELKAFYKTKTLVVLEGNPMSSFNFKIKDVMKKCWTITEYDFIELKDYDKMRKDPQYSFLTLDDVYFDKDKSSRIFFCMCFAWRKICYNIINAAIGLFPVGISWCRRRIFFV
jgi:hypothetical protein